MSNAFSISHSIFRSCLFTIRRFVLVFDEWGRVWSANEAVSVSAQISKAYQGAGGEKCKVTFLFHIQFFPVTFSTLAVFC